MLIVGIDPGITGAIATLDHTGLLSVDDIPVMACGKGAGKRKNQVNAAGLSALLKERVSGRADEVRVVLERVASMPGQGVAGVFTQAYKAVGFRAKNDAVAGVNAHNLLKDHKVQALLKERREVLREKSGLTAERGPVGGSATRGVYVQRCPDLRGQKEVQMKRNTRPRPSPANRQKTGKRGGTGDAHRLCLSPAASSARRLLKQADISLQIKQRRAETLAQVQTKTQLTEEAFAGGIAGRPLGTRLSTDVHISERGGCVEAGDTWHAP
jgi:hypothetical protein